MKTLIITYYWPPAGGSGVQRWLKFVKYLPEFSIQPIVYTVATENYPKRDESLTREIPENIEVLKKSIWEPTQVLSSKKNTNNRGVSNSVNNPFLSFIRGNFFIPDPKVFWIKKSTNYLIKYLSQNPVDCIISTGPPHSMHLIAQKVAQKTKTKWIADFRDPWTDLYYNNEFRLMKFAKKKNLKLETSVLNNADCIVTVSDTLKKELEKKAKRVEVITNGFDDEIHVKENYSLDKEFSISYIGLLPKQSNPKLLFKVLNQLCNNDKEFAKDLKLNLIGDITQDIQTELEKYQLLNNTEFYGYVTHQKAIEFQKKSQVLLLLIPDVKKSEGILTGKLFEYLTSNRPILALGPENGDLAKILEETNTGQIFSYTNEKELLEYIQDLYSNYKKGNLSVKALKIEQYHRKNLTKKLVNVLKSLHS